MSAYVYAGYPLVLVFYRAAGGARAVVRGDPDHTVTLVVSAFNEEDVIGEKIENSVALDFPKERLDIVVVSDASDDSTDRIVEESGFRNVRLLRMKERGGKTLGLNHAIRNSDSDIVVFSDANAMYRPDAVSKLVRNFADPNVGAVVGTSTYEAPATESDASEDRYWNYELAIKKLESDTGSTVGGDGAIYSIRRSLFSPLAADDLSDFVNPLQIVSRGYRCIFEPEAISVEKGAESFHKEFRRKVRIVNRAWRGTIKMRHLLNPFRHGAFSIKFLSHKVLRWLIPVFMLGIFVSTSVLAVNSVYYATFLGMQLLFYSLALIGYRNRHRQKLPMLLAVPYYFMLVNIASLKGIVEAHTGKTYTTWSTPRASR